MSPCFVVFVCVSVCCFLLLLFFVFGPSIFFFFDFFVHRNVVVFCFGVPILFDFIIIIFLNSFCQRNVVLAHRNRASMSHARAVASPGVAEM